MYIIDRFEGDWVVIEYERQTFNLPRQLLPPEALEGDVVTISIGVDAKATATVKEDIKRLARQVFKD
ncbi:hypothetical protein Psch_00908 [Pelotomaculum schinkii]|uniref:DUF3006 domain-containing protein n=1 Tax=Pelotomaculum schinkii TaxID=78350 RepID=A0A4Y7RGA7_9FIRM|nr:DUF3006 domain-containing protein [Pelotomaculum schinkii]TEB07357.1 hypothetical protein Psch_00908 [Pelotomaculum schinkii]